MAVPSSSPSSASPSSADPSAHPLFGQAWADAWRREIDAGPYREAGRAWSGPLTVVLEAEPSHGIEAERTVRLDLDAGVCRGAEALGTGSADAPETASSPAGSEESGFAETPAPDDTVLAGPPAAWARVLAGDLEPLLALAMGKLSLRSGSLARLAPHARGARELVAAARRVPTRFPEGWPAP